MGGLWRESSGLSFGQGLWQEQPGLWSGNVGLLDNGDATFSAATIAYVSAMTTPPSYQRIVLINNLILGLTADGVWVKLDWLSLFAMETAQAARLNAINPALAYSVVGSPVFVTDRGYTGVSGGYLNSGWDPATNGVQYQRNSAFIGFWCRTATATAGVPFGSQEASLNPRNASDILQGRVSQSGTNSTVTAPGPTAVGFSCIDRPDSAGFNAFRNGVNLANTVAASEALTTFDFAACGRNVSGTVTVDSIRQLAAVCWGAHLTDAEHLALYTRLNTYLTAVGAV